VIKFEKAKITKYDRHTDTAYFDLIVKLNGNQQVLKKEFKLAESFDRLRDRIISEVKQQFSNENKSYEDDDFLGGALVVVIEDYEELEESLVNFFKRVKERVRQFKSNTSAEGYLNRYTGFDNIEYDF